MNKDFDICTFLKDSLDCIDDKDKKSEIQSIISTMEQSIKDGYILLQIPSETGTCVNYQNQVKPVYERKYPAFTSSKYGKAFNFESWIICKPCNKLDSENNPIFLSYSGYHFILKNDNHIVSVCNPVF